MFVVERRLFLLSDSGGWLLICLFWLSSSAALAEVVEVSATGKAIIAENITYDQARMRALNRARALAVEQAAGVNVSSDAVIHNSLMLSELTKTFSYGFLIKESDVRWRGTWTHDEAGQLGYPVVKASITALVKVLPRSFFNGSAFTASLNKKTFISGEQAQISIKANTDLYMVIANYTADNQIVPILPNRYFDSNLVVAGSMFRLPSSKYSHINLVLENYQGHQRDDEAIIVLGFPKTTATEDISWSGLFEGKTPLSYAKFFSIITQLPVPWISEKTLVYSVVAR